MLKNQRVGTLARIDPSGASATSGIDGAPPSSSTIPQPGDMASPGGTPPIPGPVRILDGPAIDLGDMGISDDSLSDPDILQNEQYI